MNNNCKTENSEPTIIPAVWEILEYIYMHTDLHHVTFINKDTDII